MTIPSDTIKDIMEDLVKDGYAFRPGTLERATAEVQLYKDPVERFVAILDVLTDMELTPDARTH